VIWGSVASSFVQYDNKIVLISETVSGGYWEAGLFTATATMPLGSQIVFYQERFWAFGKRGTINATTVWFSKLTVISPASSIFDWVPASDFFTVSKGDGQWLTGLQADSNALLIFRSGSTYSFSYPAAPASGTLRQLSATIGAENIHSIVQYENYYLIYSAGFLYQFINYRHYPLNTKKINFQRASLANPLQFDIRLSVFGRRAILWFFGATYVYNIVSSTWSTWNSSTTRAGHFMTVPASSTSGESRVALATTGENVAGKKKLWRIEEDVLPSGAGEEMTCTVRTKAYSLDDAADYKRLLYWTVEIRSAVGVTANAYPTALSTGSTTWNDMMTHNWNDFGTWNNPLIPEVVYVDTVAFPTLAPVRTVVKMTAPFRFLSGYYEIVMECDGTAATSPSRIYSITPYLKVKAGVSRKVS
jgi:hypothetical protein